MTSSNVKLSELQVADVLKHFVAYVNTSLDYSMHAFAFPILLPIEQELSSIWPTVEQFSDEQLTNFRNQITRSICLDFLTYSYRMATYAIREKNLMGILYSLFATVIDNKKSDRRDTLSVFSLCFDAARVLEISPVELFYRASKLAIPSRAELTRNYVDDPEYPKTIEEMGFARVETPDGPRYVQIL